MHYCCLVVRKVFPTEEVLEEALAPFKDDVVWDQPAESCVYPAFTWDWWQVGGRYSGQFKLKVNENDEKYRWEYYAREPRAGRLFRSYIIEKMIDRLKCESSLFGYFQEEDFFRSMGINDYFLYVDGGKASDIINLDEVDCWCYVDADGNGYARDYWHGDGFTVNADFDEKLKEVIEKSKDYYVCVVDLHD